MTAPTVADICAAIPRLAPEERARVRQHIDAAGSLGKATSGRLDAAPGRQKDWLLDGIADYLIREGLLIQRLRMTLPGRQAFKSYQSKQPALMDYLVKLEQQQGLGSDYNDRAQLAFVCAMTLGDYLKSINVFKVSTMLSQVDKIPEALDAAFPGYIQAGLLRFVFRKTHG